MAEPRERRFPPPWTVEDIGAAFVVIDIISVSLWLSLGTNLSLRTENSER
jgi:hypothetical protein